MLSSPTTPATSTTLPAALLTGLGADAQERRLYELNVIEQVVNAAQTTIVQQAWERGQDLAVNASGPRELAEGYRRALDAITAPGDYIGGTGAS